MKKHRNKWVDIGYSALCLILPIVGGILYFLWREQYYHTGDAQICKRYSIIGGIIWGAMLIVFIVVMILVSTSGIPPIIL